MGFDARFTQVVVARCPICGAEAMSADGSGLEGLTCAYGHPSSPYKPVGDVESYLKERRQA